MNELEGRKMTAFFGNTPNGSPKKRRMRFLNAVGRIVLPGRCFLIVTAEFIKAASAFG